MQQQIIQYCCLHASGCWYFSFFSVLLALDCFPIQMTAAAMASTLKYAYLSIYNWSVFFGRLADSSPLWNLGLLSCWLSCWMIRICVDVGCRCSTTRCWIVYLDVYVASREALYNYWHEYLDFPNKYRTVPMHTDYYNKTENKNWSMK